jgi:MFS family permease
VAAVVRSRRHATPAIETSLWRSRTFAAANAASLLYGAALFPWLLVGVLFLIQIWGYSPLQAGFAMTPGAVIAAIVALRSGPLVGRYGPRLVVVAGALTLAAAGFLGAFTLPSEPSFLTWWLPVGVLIGLGTGAITTGTSTAAMLSVAPARFAAAGGLNQTARQVGGALGLAFLAAALSGGEAGDVGPYTDVYLFCAVSTLAVALVGCWLVLEERPS